MLGRQEQLHLDGSVSIISADLRGNRTGHALAGNGLVGQLGEARSQIQSRSLRAARRALTSAGDRDAADEIRYYGRVRERETENGFSYIWSGALQYVAGFVLAPTPFGFSIGSSASRSSARSILGREFKGCAMRTTGLFGASAPAFPALTGDRDQPGIHRVLQRSQTGTFDRLAKFYFSVIGIVGFLLAAILGAAVSGLTQSS